jgi:hypothetical protein
MSNFQRLLNMASKALDKNSQSSSTGTGKTGDTDWRDLVRTAADKVTGDSRPAGHTSNPEPGAPNATHAPRSARPSRSTQAPATASAPAGSAEDRAAIGRYNYLLKTAQPEQLEQVHRDAFARLTPAQREQLNAQLRTELPANEMPASAGADDLARAATRGEAQHPGFLRKVFGKPAKRSALGAGAVGAVAGAGLGAAGGLLAAVAGGAVVSSVAAPLLEQAAGLGVDFENLAGGFDGVTEGLADGASEYTSGLADGATEYTSGLADGASEYTSGLGEKVSDFGSNFEIPGLGDLGKLFGRD